MSVTVLPFLTARRSVTGRASSSEGGRGSPGLPQAASSESESSANPKTLFGGNIPDLGYHSLLLSRASWGFKKGTNSAMNKLPQKAYKRALYQARGGLPYRM